MKTSSFVKTALTVFALVMVVVSLMAASAQQSESSTAQRTVSPVRTHPSQGDVREIEGAAAELFTTQDGFTVNLSTSQLEPGHVYTAWLVMINNPEACSTSPCEAPDILGNSEAIQSEITYGDGIIVGEDGIGNFAAHLNTGEVPGGWHGIPLANPLSAEIHVVINDHGPLISEQAANMLNTYRGGCTDESLPPPFPATAKADGEPGPNTCRLVQTAIFRQQ